MDIPDLLLVVVAEAVGVHHRQPSHAPLLDLPLSQLLFVLVSALLLDLLRPPPDKVWGGAPTIPTRRRITSNSLSLSSLDEELMAEIPDGWWLMNNATHLLLAVLVHRSNPDVVSDPTTVPAGQTRESIRKNSEKETLERRDVDRIVERHATGRQRAEESMLESKAKLMAQTIDSGTIDQVKEQLSLLSQFKESFVKVKNRLGEGKGEDEYDETAHDLLSELPFLKKRRTSTTVANSKVSNLPDFQST